MDNVSPPLTGVRVASIPLAGAQGATTRRVAFSIWIPEGITAYQARDRIYYGRSEHGCNPMPDHEIRWRMLQGRVARAQLHAGGWTVRTAEEERAKRQGEITGLNEGRRGRHPPDLEAPKRAFDEWSFQFEVENTGELTISDFMLDLKPTFDSDIRTELPDFPYRFNRGKQRTSDSVSSASRQKPDSSHANASSWLQARSRFRPECEEEALSVQSAGRSTFTTPYPVKVSWS